jgi:hypothetical protein
VDSVLLHLTDAPLLPRPLGLVRLQREALHALCADCIGDDQGAKFNTLLVAATLRALRIAENLTQAVAAAARARRGSSCATPRRAPYHRNAPARPRGASEARLRDARPRHRVDHSRPLQPRHTCDASRGGAQPGCVASRARRGQLGGQNRLVSAVLNTKNWCAPLRENVCTIAQGALVPKPEVERVGPGRRDGPSGAAQGGHLPRPRGLSPVDRRVTIGSTGKYPVSTIPTLEPPEDIREDIRNESVGSEEGAPRR